MNLVKLKTGPSLPDKDNETLKNVCQKIATSEPPKEEIINVLKKISDRGRLEWDAGTSVLHAAVRSGRKDLVELLIKDGLGFNVESTEEDQTALTTAIKNGQKEMISFLASDMRAQVNPKRTHLCPLLTALDTGDLEVVKLLVEDCGADVNLKIGVTSWTPLYVAMNLEMR